MVRDKWGSLNTTRTYVFDAENRLVGVSGDVTATFSYDGDGRRVKAVVGGTTTYYIGGHFESTGGVVTKYYDAAGRRIAMNVGGTVYYLLGDHLGSTSILKRIPGIIL